MGAIEYAIDNWDRLLEFALQHIGFVLLSIVIATVIGVALGVLTYQRPTAAALVIAVSATILTIPSFALFGLGITFFGIGNLGPVIGLILYSQLPIVRNTITGLQEVDPAVVESARGMGMSRWQSLWRIELPLAWPVVLTGVRVATLIVTSIFAIAAYVGASGLGREIDRGLSNLGAAWAFDVVLTATVAIVLVALVLDVLYMLIGKLTIPRGVRS